MALTLLELAANVRQRKIDLDKLCGEMRNVGGEWTIHSIAGEDAMRIADDGLRNCWTMLERLRQIASEDLAKMTPNASLEGCGAAGGASLSKRLLGTDDERNRDAE